MIETGATGNALDPHRKVRRTSYVIRARPAPAVASTWPVREVVTHRLVEVVADLRAELDAAGSDDAEHDLGVIRRWWSSMATPPEARHETDDHQLDATLLSRAYPLLAVPVAAGARPRAVPVAAEPMLHHANPRDAVIRSFGRATRPLIRALAERLLPEPDGSITWEPILAALMAAGRCGPEQIVDILTTPVHHAGAVAFSHQEVFRARTMFAERNPRQVATALTASLAEAGGTARLATEILAWDARPPAPARPPQDQPPQNQPPRPEPTARVAVPVADRGARPTPYPERIRFVEGMSVTGHRVELVARPDDLVRWGAQLHNCLGAYRDVVAAGRTHIFGFSCQGELRVVVEISPARVLRQLETAGNTRPPPAIETELLVFLRRHRLVEVDGRRA